MNQRLVEIQKLLNHLKKIKNIKHRDLNMDKFTCSSKQNIVIENSDLLQLNQKSQNKEKLNSEEFVMTDIVKIMDVIKRINAYCNEIDKLGESNLLQYQNEKISIEKQTSDLISDMQRKFDAFKNDHFFRIKNEIQSLIDIISKDYPDEVRFCSTDVSEYSAYTYEENEQKLFELIGNINGYIKQLNEVDFDVLVPPLKVEVAGETFITYTGSKENVKNFDVNSKPQNAIVDPNPIRQLVKNILPYCTKVNSCVDALSSQYDNQFNISGFNSYVKSSATAWLAELKAKLDSEYSTRFDQLFRDEKAKAVPKTFFEQLIADGAEADVDITTGSSDYREAINIGDMKLLVEQKSKHLEYIKESPVLRKYLQEGYLSAPLILNLKDRGNILLNIDEENYSEETVRFVNQLIVQFLLAFPANRITFCLIDIDNKMDFSKFKSLTRINNSILFNVPDLYFG